MNYFWIAFELIGGLIIGFFSAGYVLEQIFSVLNSGREGRWGMLLAGFMVIGPTLATGFYFKLYVGLWSCLSSTCLLLLIVAFQNIKLRKHADEFGSDSGRSGGAG